MKILTSFISFFLILLQNEFSEAIIDGKSASKGEFPFQVSFQKIPQSNKHFCGGSIIHSMFVLTAAHCVAGQVPKDTRLVAGVANLKDKLSVNNIRHIADQYLHFQYNRPLPRDNDIAIVKVDTAWKFDKYIGVALLPLTTSAVPVGHTVYETGWGVEKTEATKGTDVLKKAKVQILNHEECVKKYQGKLKISQFLFCTVHEGSKNKGVCKGDSGGPVTIDKKHLVGVIEGSYSLTECGSNNTPDFHTDVAKYRTWIDETMGGHL